MERDRRRVVCDERLDRADLRQGAVRLGDGEVIPERCRRRLAAGLEMIDEPTRAALRDQADRALRLASAVLARGEHARCDPGEDEYQCDCSAHPDSSVRRLIRRATFMWGLVGPHREATVMKLAARLTPLSAIRPRSKKSRQPCHSRHQF